MHPVFDKEKVTLSSPRDSQNLGLEMVYQDLALAGNLPIGDNIFLGNYIPAINYYYSSKIKSLIFLRKVKNNGNVMFNRNN